MVNILTDPSSITDICRRYEEGETGAEIGRSYGISRQSVYRLMDERGIQRRRAGSRPTYTHDRSFFDRIDTQDKAYWLGFIAADGSVCNGALQVTLADADSQHLYRLRDCLHSDHPIRHFTQNTFGREWSMAKLHISSPELRTSLQYHGIGPSKTTDLVWPSTIPESLHRHYLRGYVDGDGGFYVHKRQQLVFSLISTAPFCYDARAYLMHALGLSAVKLRIPKHSPATSVLEYSGNKQVRRIHHLLYADAEHYLPRKLDRVLGWV